MAVLLPVLFVTGALLAAALVTIFVTHEEARRAGRIAYASLQADIEAASTSSSAPRS